MATDDSTTSTAADPAKSPPTTASSKAKATAYARNKPPSPNPSTEPAQMDAVAMEKYALGHSSSVLWWLLEDFGQPVELDLVFQARVIHLAVSLAAIC